MNIYTVKFPPRWLVHGMVCYWVYHIRNLVLRTSWPRFSDTTNLYLSRLVHAGHRVTLACRHFHVVDKIGSTHGDPAGAPSGL